ncbi:MAG TPA: hypothetical protein VFO53_06080 [Casimicrobiaceae bacterium]|nr:hypothetical protein [Casimicrobiaceae bacterium]
MHSYMKSKLRVSAVSAAVAAALGLVAGNAVAISQSGEAKNMIRVGHTDLQGRPTYQPNVIKYPDGRTILFVGQHSGNPRPVAGYRFLPNPLNHNADENNGTMIIDVTDPRNPVEKALIPAPVAGNSVGQSQMTRMCLGSQLPGGTPGKVYLLRNSQSGNLAISGYQIWDVTDVEHPVKTSEQMGLRSTHKVWWECSTGIIYAPGSLSTPPLWKESQAMLVYDWHDVNNPPHFIRMFGLPGGEPGGTVTTSLHGAISAHDHPMAAQKLARADDVIGNRIYAAWGVGDDGVITIIDRKKLLPKEYGGTWVPATADSATQPLETELIGPNSPTVGYFTMSPDQGGHTSMPVFGIKPPSYGKYNEFQTRDVVVVTSEATADGKDGRCNEAPHWAFTLDVTVENSMSVPPGTKVERDPYQGPMVLGTMSVDPRSGEQSKRGNFCERGARFGVHSVEENFNNPYYGKLTAIAYFNGGIRIWDIREPQAPREVAFYVPEADALTDPDGYMTNNVEIDNRGYIYVVDRNGAGMDILELNGCAKQIADNGQTCPDLGNNNAAR